MTAPVVAAAVDVSCPEVDCPELLRLGYAGQGFQVAVSLVAPLVRGPWEPWVCCHGTHYWVTVAQRTVWAREVPT